MLKLSISISPPPQFFYLFCAAQLLKIIFCLDLARLQDTGLPPLQIYVTNIDAYSISMSSLPQHLRNLNIYLRSFIYLET